MSFLNSLPLSSQAGTASGLAADILTGTATGGFPSVSQLGNLAGSIANKTTGLAAFLSNPVGYSTMKLFGGSSSDHVLARIVTGLLGLLLIAAAIFTHPTVINVGKKVGKAAGEVGLAA